jgi:uncharacterized lipoprotein YmbA
MNSVGHGLPRPGHPPIQPREASGLTRRRLLPAVALLVASCASPNPSLYTLEVLPGAVRRPSVRIIELRSIGLARYLERSQIVRSSENFRLDVLANDWWGEPLDAMIGRTLDRALAQRLPGSTVYQESGAISAEPDARVQVNIERFDEDASGAVRLVAQYAVVRRISETRGVTLEVPTRGATTADLVAAMSEAIGQLADRIASSLAIA